MYTLVMYNVNTSSVKYKYIATSLCNSKCMRHRDSIVQSRVSYLT